VRRVLWIVGAVLALFAAFVIAAFFLIDAEKLREPLREAASKALGREVTIGGLDLDLLPLPSLEASELRVAGARADTPDFAQVASVRLRVALLPLLRKQVVVRALELQQPRIFVSLDREGRPELPGAAGGSDASRAEPAPAPERTSATPSLAVQSLRIRKGDLRYGDWQLSGLDVDGSLGLDGAGRARIRTNLQGPVRASAVDADTRFQLDLASGELRAASAEVHVDELDYASGETRLRGPVDLSASLGQRWSVDFRGAELRVPGAVHKKAGTQLSLAGELAQVPSPESLGPFDVRLAGSELRVTPELARGRVSVAGPLDLAALRPVLDPGRPELGGQITLDGMGVELEGIRLFGAASLDAVTAPTPQGQILVSGQLRGRGRQLVLEQGRAEIGGQPVQLDASYDLDSGKAKLQTRTSEAQVWRRSRAVPGWTSRAAGSRASRCCARCSGTWRRCPCWWRAPRARICRATRARSSRSSPAISTCGMACSRRRTSCFVTSTRRRTCGGRWGCRPGAPSI
jgi:hypothetical protein